jgi:hypothetical protein
MNEDHRQHSVLGTSWRILQFFILSFSLSRSHAITLTTQSTIRGVATRELQDFLATPTHWPLIVASSHSVESTTAKMTAMNPVDRPLVVGEHVREIFGLPPILPLSVDWTCRRNDEHGLDFDAPEGLASVAINCSMRFQFRSQGSDNTQVTLTISFDPVSPVANAAIPILILDNELALKVLLPLQLSRRKGNLLS